MHIKTLKLNSTKLNFLLIFISAIAEVFCGHKNKFISITHMAVNTHYNGSLQGSEQKEEEQKKCIKIIASWHFFITYKHSHLVHLSPCFAYNSFFSVVMAILWLTHKNKNLIEWKEQEERKSFYILWASTNQFA